jgi:DNA primase
LFYSDETIAEVRERSDLLRVIGRYVDLKPSGGGNHAGLCPFHAEKTPSFTVNPDKGFFYCFGCHAGGDVYKFLMRAANLTFPEAVEELAREAGVTLPAGGAGRFGSRSGDKTKKARLYRIMARAAEVFRENLWSGAGGVGARNRLRARGVEDSVAREFSLGYSGPDWRTLVQKLGGEGFSSEELLEAGLAKESARPDGTKSLYDTFRDRLMVPVMDSEFRVVAFAGRHSGEPDPGGREAGPKYVNSPTTPIHKKGHLLYGFPQARPFVKSAGTVFAVEGYFDLISMVAGGIKNVVASMGTALTQAQVNSLRGLARRVILLFDGDEAGRDAAKKALPKLLNAEIEGTVACLPKGHDPDSFVREKGPEALLALVERSSRDAVDFAVEKIMASHPDTLMGKVLALKEARELLDDVADGGKARILQGELAKRLGVDRDEIPLADPSAKTRFELPDARETPVANTRSGAILSHVIAHPETADHLPGLGNVWPDDDTKPFFLDLLAALEAGGSIDPKAILKRGRDDFLEALVSRAAVTGRDHDPETARLIMLDFAGQLKNSRLRERIDDLSRELKLAEDAGDEARYVTLKKKKMLLRAELDEALARGGNF